MSWPVASELLLYHMGGAYSCKDTSAVLELGSQNAVVNQIDLCKNLYYIVVTHFG